MKRNALFALTLTAFALAPAAALSDPPAVSDPLAVVAGVLELSLEQTQALAQNAQALAKSLEQARQLATAKEREIETLAQANLPDLTLLGKAVLDLRTIRGQAASALDAYHQSFAGLLTPDQASRAQTVSDAAGLQAAVAAFIALGLVAPPGPQP
jgi:hypothetical protein